MTEHVDTDYHHDQQLLDDQGGPYVAYTAPPPPQPPNGSPSPIKATVKLNDAPPRQPKRAWPLGARLAVTVFIIGLATIAIMSLISLGTASKRASDANQLVNSEQASLNTMRSQLAALQAKAGVPIQLPKPYRPPAVLQHYGICVAFDRDSGTGDLVNVNFTTPQVSAGSYSCSAGTLVSVVPTP